MSSYGGRNKKELSGVSFIKAPIPLMRAPSSQLNHLPKIPIPNIITLKIRFPHMNVGRTQIHSL